MLAERLRTAQERIARACRRAGRDPGQVTLVAVTKGVGPAQIEEAYRLGLRHFGENRVQEAQGKIGQLSLPGATWHLVGHLQSNKARLALGVFDTVDSLDSVRLARALGQRSGKPLPVLLEVNISGEATKFGFSPQELPGALEEIARLPNLEVQGLMTVAPLVPDPEQARPVFRRLREMGQALGLRELSMGMSDDFEVALDEGATQLRLGRAIFGERSAVHGAPKKSPDFLGLG